MVLFYTIAAVGLVWLVIAMALNPPIPTGFLFHQDTCPNKGKPPTSVDDDPKGQPLFFWEEIGLMPYYAKCEGCGFKLTKVHLSGAQDTAQLVHA